MKQRPHIPPPVITPPSAAPNINASAVTTTVVGEPPALVVVRPPARVASWKVHADHVEFINPTIDFPEAVWLKHVFPHQQVKNGRLEPARAIVAHGMILIEEYGLALSCGRASIRTVIKETP